MTFTFDLHLGILFYSLRHPTLSLLTTKTRLFFFFKVENHGKRVCLVAKWMGVSFKLQISTPSLLNQRVR